jgi:hypothetical protein
MSLPPVRIRTGGPAELLAVRAGSLAEAVGGASEARLVWHRGVLVSGTRVMRVFGAGGRDAGDTVDLVVKDAGDEVASRPPGTGDTAGLAGRSPSTSPAPRTEESHDRDLFGPAVTDSL